MTGKKSEDDCGTSGRRAMGLDGDGGSGGLGFVTAQVKPSGAA